MAAVDVSPDQYAIGKGRVYFALNDTSGTLGGYRFLGNCPSLSFTPSSNTLTHQTSTNGLSVEDRNIQISSALALAFSCDNISDENFALFQQGTVDTIIQTAITSSVNQQFANVQKGYGYQIGAGVTGAQPYGYKSISVGANAVTNITQTNAVLVAGTDYTINPTTGMIFIMTTTSAVANGDTVRVSYTVAASNKDVTNNRALSLTGAMKYVTDNPDTGKGILNFEHFFPSVRLTPSGDFSLITETWQSMSFSGDVFQLTDAAGNAIPRHQRVPLF